MAFETTSPNMNLVLPGVGTTAGPQYATDINASLSIIDQHDHSLGAGVQITPSGININAELTFNSMDAIALRTTRFTDQTTLLSLPTDLDCLYASNGDLYYNDGVGNQVRITQSGGVAGSPGSIAGLVPPASATYVSLDATFVWQSDVNKPANMDAASYIFRNLTTNSKGLTLEPPNAMAADYAIVLPSLPVSTSFLQMDSSGNITAAVAVSQGITAANIAPLTITDAQLAPDSVITSKILNLAVTTAKIANAAVTDVQIANLNITTPKIANLAVTTAKIDDAAVTQPKLGGLNDTLSGSSGAYTLTGTVADTSITNLSVTLTTSSTGNRPVEIQLLNADSINASFIQVSRSAATARVTFRLYKNAVLFASYILQGSGSPGVSAPSSSIKFIDFSIAASTSYTYTLTSQADTTADSVTVNYARLYARES